MNYSTSNIFNLKTIKALRGDVFKLDLGKTFSGTLEAWLKRSPNDLFYRKFSVIDGRYLTLSKVETSDYYDAGGTLTNAIEGKWYFDVEQTEGAETKTIFTGTIIFKNDITNSKGTIVS